MNTDVGRQCPFCGKKTHLSVDSLALDNYYAGLNIVEALPNLTAFDREVIKTGMCYSCQEETFGVPAPGHEEAWGTCLGECECCGTPIYSEHNKAGDAYVCRNCGLQHYYKDGELKGVEE